MLKDEDIAKITIDFKTQRIYLLDNQGFLVRVRPWEESHKTRFFPFAKSSAWGHVIMGLRRALVDQYANGR